MTESPPPLSSDPELGLLLELDEHGALSVRTLLDEYDVCESDLHGAVATLRAGGLVRLHDRDPHVEYTITADGREAIRDLEESG